MNVSYPNPCTKVNTPIPLRKDDPSYLNSIVIALFVVSVSTILTRKENVSDTEFSVDSGKNLFQTTVLASSFGTTDIKRGSGVGRQHYHRVNHV